MRSGLSSREDISKELPPKASSGLIFKGLCSEANAECLVIIGKSLLKPLKNKTTGNESYRYPLEKSGMIEN